MTCFSKQFILLKTTNLLTFVKLIDLFRKTRLLKNTHVLKLTCFERSVIKRLTDSTTSTMSGQTDITSGQKSTTNRQM